MFQCLPVNPYIYIYYQTMAVQRQCIEGVVVEYRVQIRSAPYMYNVRVGRGDILVAWNWCWSASCAGNQMWTPTIWVICNGRRWDSRAAHVMIWKSAREDLVAHQSCQKIWHWDKKLLSREDLQEFRGCIMAVILLLFRTQFTCQYELWNCCKNIYIWYGPFITKRTVQA